MRGNTPCPARDGRARLLHRAGSTSAFEPPRHSESVTISSSAPLVIRHDRGSTGGSRRGYRPAHGRRPCSPDTGAHHRRPENRCLGDRPGREIAAPAPTGDPEPVWIGDASLDHGQRARHEIARLSPTDVILEEPLQLASIAGASSWVGHQARHSPGSRASAPNRASSASRGLPTARMAHREPPPPGDSTFPAESPPDKSTDPRSRRRHHSSSTPAQPAAVAHQNPCQTTSGDEHHPKVSPSQTSSGVEASLQIAARRPPSSENDAPSMMLPRPAIAAGVSGVNLPLGRSTA